MQEAEIGVIRAVPGGGDSGLLRHGNVDAGNTFHFKTGETLRGDAEDLIEATIDASRLPNDGSVGAESAGEVAVA